MKSRKLVLMNLFAGRNRDLQAKNGFVDTVGEEVGGMNWLDLLAVQGTLNSLLQHHSSKAPIL